MDLMDGFYPILMRERYIPFTAQRYDLGVACYATWCKFWPYHQWEMYNKYIEIGARLRTDLLRLLVYVLDIDGKTDEEFHRIFL